jgi:hypothetical protein
MWFELLKLNHDEVLSRFALSFILRLYTSAAAGLGHAWCLPCSGGMAW